MTSPSHSTSSAFSASTKHAARRGDDAERLVAGIEDEGSRITIMTLTPRSVPRPVSGSMPWRSLIALPLLAPLPGRSPHRPVREGATESPYWVRSRNRRSSRRVGVAGTVSRPTTTTAAVRRHQRRAVDHNDGRRATASAARISTRERGSLGRPSTISPMMLRWISTSRVDRARSSVPDVRPTTPSCSAHRRRRSGTPTMAAGRSGPWRRRRGCRRPTR